MAATPNIEPTACRSRYSSTAGSSCSRLSCAGLRCPTPWSRVWSTPRSSAVGQLAYLHGQARGDGWWYCHPLAVLLRYPAPALLLANVGPDCVRALAGARPRSARRLDAAGLSECCCSGRWRSTSTLALEPCSRSRRFLALWDHRLDSSFVTSLRPANKLLGQAAWAKTLNSSIH